MIICYKPDQRADTKFSDWMKQVDALLINAYGIDHTDLVDYLWRDLFDDDYTPREAFAEWRDSHED